MPSLPLIPTPTWAVWIMPTSLAPSPMASVMAFTCFFTMSTISDFCSGDTLWKNDGSTGRKSESMIMARMNLVKKFGGGRQRNKNTVSEKVWEAKIQTWKSKA